MKIIVLVKQVPDTWSDRKLNTTSNLLDRRASEPVVDEINERAVEVALTYRDSNKSAEVVALSMGPAGATDAIRKVMAMGVDSGIHIVDDELAGSDLGWTAAVIAAALSRSGYDLVIAGNESTDGRGGLAPAMVAEHLGMPHLTFLNSVDIGSHSVSGMRATDNGTLKVHASLPALISITEQCADARFPNFKGIMSAKKKPIETLCLADLNLDLSELGRSVSVSTIERPERLAGTKIIDNGTAAAELAEFLNTARLI